MSTHALSGGRMRIAIATVLLIAVFGVALVPSAAHALSLGELIELFIALEIIPADKAVQARGIVSQEQTTPSAACPYTWTRNLTVGATGADVKKLQEFLNGTEATRISGTGSGSLGKESTYFGSLTGAAVAKFQNIYATETLKPAGLTKGTGYFGSLTRAKANALCATSVVGGVTNPNPVGGTISDVPTIPAGTGLTVKKSAVQPANALLPEGAARVPFTTIELSAGSESITVTGITVARQGLASNNSFAGVVLLDENGTILGNAKTLNTDNQAVVGGTFVVPSGMTKKVTVAANMNADLALQTGEVPSFAIIGVNTASTVNATFPIIGAQHTINSSLLIGGVTMSRGSLDPNNSLDKTVGTKDYVFSSVKVTATANEDVLLKSIRWYQSESASAEDVENVKTILDGVEYTAVRDGRYYQTVFPSTGILIKKGLSKDVSVKADIVSGSGRAIDFDIERDTDLNLVGTTYGYGVTPPPGTGITVDGSVFRASNNPYYDASQVSVSAGTMNVSGWTQVSAANVGTSVIGEKLMGFTVEVRGEPVTVGSLTASIVLANVSGGTAPSIADLTNIVLTDANGAILAGPRDGSGTGLTGNITFTESITFPVGITNVYVKGKLGTAFETNDTVVVSTDPSTQWTSVRGENTSATLTLTSGTVTGQTMTVRGGALTISVSGLPASQTVIAGAQQFEFARYIFDASRSSENIRLSTLPLDFANVGATRTDLTSCKLYDGATALTTGGNVKNPAVGETPEATTFTFDNGGFVIPEGSIKTLSLKCTIKSGATGTYQWGIDNSVSYTGATGVETGLTVDETVVTATGPIMTASAMGGYTVSEDTSLIYRIVQAGSSDVELARFRFEAGVGEDVSVKQIALELNNANDNAPTDLQNEKVSLWIGATKVGEAQFGGATSDEAIATLSTPITIPRGDSVTVSVKGDLSTHNAISGTPGARLTVGYNGNENGLDGNYGKGLASGITINGVSSDVSSNGVRIFRTLPQIEDVTPVNITLGAGSDLYQVKITASNGRDVGVRSLAFNVSEVGATVDNYQLYGPNGAVNATAVRGSRVLTGTIDPAASTAVVGVGTLFTTELVVGDDITVSGETRTVTVITNDTNLTVGTAFSDTANDTSPDRIAKVIRIVFDDSAIDRVVPANGSKTYRLRANTVSGLTSGAVETLTAALRADTAYPSANVGTTLMGTVAEVETNVATEGNFIWTPFSVTSPQTGAGINGNDDWTNGYGIPGFPGIGQNMQVRVFSH